MKATISARPNCPSDTYHRAGLVFGHARAVYDVDDEQYTAITNDPMLVVHKAPKAAPTPAHSDEE